MRIDIRKAMRVTSYARAIRFWAFVVLGLLAYFGFNGEARAVYNGTIDRNSCSSFGATCSAAQAYQACQLFLTYQQGISGSTYQNFRCTPFTGDRYTLQADAKSNGATNNYGSRLYTDTVCPTGSTWDATQHKCHNPAQCLAKNDALQTAIKDTARSTNSCHDGCAMSMGTEFTESVITVPTGGGPVEARAFHGKFRYTGAACTVPDPKAPESKQPECFDIEGTSTCKREDGKMCHRATNGTISKYGCWNPGETGEKPVDNVLQKKNAGPDAIPPANLMLPSGDTLAPVGPPTKVTENVPGKGPVTTTTQNYQTINNTNTATDGGAGEGVPGSGPGGTPEGNGGDDGGGDDGETAGPPGGILDMSGRIPGAEDRSIASVIGGFQARASNSPIIGAATGFFDVQAGGTCPTWQIPGTDWTPAISVDFWCASSLGPVWTGIGWICICVYSFGAFRWAVL